MNKMTKKYTRTIEELRRLASMFWPLELSQREAELSVIPKLVETQDQFIAVLSVDVPDLTALFRVVDSSKLSGNMFLKHLVVLADFGGEMLQRINGRFHSLFPSRRLAYLWNGKRHTYAFKRLPIKGVLNNEKLGMSGRTLLREQPLDELHKDVVAILLLGSMSSDEKVAEILSKCEIRNYLGQPSKLDRFIKQRYIWVSRITGGARANALGQAAQNFVKEYVQANLKISRLKIKSSGQLPRVTHTDPETNRPTTFDLVVSVGNKYAAIEVSFQVTTNSTIERKAGQARSRFEQINRAGHRIAYVVDGAGNFQRENAIQTLCAHSHYTVAFSRSELDVLCQFLRKYFAN